jgi:hypothetical protein
MCSALKALCLINSKDPRLRIDVYTVVDSAAVTVTTSPTYYIRVVSVVRLPSSIRHDR